MAFREALGIPAGLLAGYAAVQCVSAAAIFGVPAKFSVCGSVGGSRVFGADFSGGRSEQFGGREGGAVSTGHWIIGGEFAIAGGAGAPRWGVADEAGAATPGASWRNHGAHRSADYVCGRHAAGGVRAAPGNHR